VRGMSLGSCRAMSAGRTWVCRSCHSSWAPTRHGGWMLAWPSRTSWRETKSPPSARVPRKVDVDEQQGVWVIR